MVMSWIWTGMIALSVLCSTLFGQGNLLSASVLEGAQAGVTLSISMAGAICLWSGVGKLMEHIGLTGKLSRLLRPILNRVFPSSAEDGKLAGSLSANICANFLGLGNAATPMGIDAAKRMRSTRHPDSAADELCRLIVLNTASIQLIPANVATVRASLGCRTPFDILPAVWISSIASAGLGVTMACLLGKVWRND